MIDIVNIFSKGGIVLWSYNFYDIGEATLRVIVKNVLIEEKYDEFCKKYNNYYVKWKLINDLDLVILIVYQGIQNASYLDNIFLKIKKALVKLFPNSVDVFEIEIPINFNNQFFKILDESDNIDHKNSNNGTKKKEKNNKSKSEEEKSNDNDEKKTLNNKNKSKIKKSAREWDSTQKVTKKDFEKLDYSKNENENNYSNNQNNYNEMEKYEGETDYSSDESIENNNTFLNKINCAFLKFFSKNNKIEEEDIEKILQEIRNKLLSKNVAVNICDTLINRMKENLIGKKKSIFSSNIKNIVSSVLTETIQTILIPKSSIDVLRSALKSKSLGKLYSIVFLGVNGVGKSTNLAKVCYYLKNKGNLKIMIAACDTFRAGAVEQLRTHANCLNVFLYEKGYGKDASNIAKDAILYAKKENYDVILIDTAGRMQDNEPLMRSLGKLILNNNPDLILFVGEALVGNDAIDQLKKFNQTLTEATSDSVKRTIDGIILTKFDTVDDKVGTALSMVYLTGKPIVFVGVGQKYTHLRKFNVNMIVKALS